MVTVGDNEYAIPVRNSFDALCSLKTVSMLLHMFLTFLGMQWVKPLTILLGAGVVLNAPVHVFMDSGVQVNSQVQFV